MITKLILIFLALAKFTISTNQIPFLQQDTEEKWFINDEAMEKLKQFGDRNIHVVAIGGPTRAGKSFTMGNVLSKFDKVHFGTFVHGKTLTSVTEGVDISLVEIKNQLILLLDCEGLASLSKKMDPKLMTIMSLISQQMIYLTLDVTTDLFDHLGVMLANRKVAVQTISGSNGKKLSEKDLPLDTLQVVLNQTDLEGDGPHGRNSDFIQNVLQSNLYGGVNIKVPFNRAFPNQNLLFITYLEDGYEDIFALDVEIFFDTITSSNYVSPFTFEGNVYTINEYLNHIQIVLDNVNNNEKMIHKSKTELTFIAMANNVISELMATDMEIQDGYMEDHEIQKLINKIENKKKEFEKRTFKYADKIVQKKQLFFEELDDFIAAAKERNERFADVIVDNITEYSETDETTTETEDGLECTIAITKKYCRNVATQKDGEKIYGDWKFYDTSRRTIDAKKEESVFNTVVSIATPILIQVASNVIANKISDALTKKSNQMEKPLNSSDPFDRLHENTHEHYEHIHSYPESEYMTLDDNILNSDFHQNFDDQVQIDTRCDAFEPKIQLCSYSHVEESNNTNSNSQIKESVKGLENGIMKGYDEKNKKWYPHKSPEGGFDTIGFGHKITSKAEQDKFQKYGISNEEVNQLFNKDWQKAREGAAKQLKNHGWDNATEVQKDLATELHYNTGNLKQYKKFNGEFKNGNTQGMMAENNRGFTDGNGKRQQLKTRQNEINKAAQYDMSNSSNNREMKI